MCIKLLDPLIYQQFGDVKIKSTHIRALMQVIPNVVPVKIVHNLA